MQAPIPPGSTIGIMGGGQLGRMAAVAASQLGYCVHIYNPEADCPAAEVSHDITAAAYDDKAALEAFADAVDVVTFEFENVPAESVQFLESKTIVRPSWNVLEISQNRIREKTFLNEKAGCATAPFHPVHNLDDLKAAFEKLGDKLILKTTELGYDGKGQYVLSKDDDLEAVWNEAAMSEGIAEGFVDFEAELSAIIARNEAEETKTYPVARNVHKGGILDTSTAPDEFDEKIEARAQYMALKIADALELRGLLAVEFFLTKSGELLVNEIAPRPHNSGHWTMNGCVTDQFEQFIRAVCGLPLGDVRAHSKVKMENLIGNDVDAWENVVRDPRAKLHLYGKKEARPGRKMGHVNFIISD